MSTTLPMLKNFNSLHQIFAFSFCLIVSSLAGCEQQNQDLPPIQSSSGRIPSNVDEQGQTTVSVGNPAHVPSPGMTEETKPKDAKYNLKVSTNLYGAHLVVMEASDSDDSDSSEEPEEPLAETSLLAGDKTAEFEIPADKTVTIRADICGFIQQSKPLKVTKDLEIDVEFDLLSEGDYRELIKSGTCLVRMPDGGFGSGFLYGDRQTIATAAHCIATKNVDDLIFTFYPDEAREVSHQGASLIFHDQKQDVALVRLDEPVGEGHYWLWSEEPAKSGAEVLVMGNPGRNGEYDPMYARTCKVASVRPDELRLDVEIYPGYSGGPVVREGSSDVLGIVSYKIVRSGNYEQVGYSFARSSDIAGDAFTQWSNLTEDLKQSHIDRVEQRYSREYGRNKANSVAATYYADSAVYTLICISLLQDYHIHMARQNAAIFGGTISQRRIIMKKAHEEYLEKVAPEVAERVRKRVSPKLRGQYVIQDHETVLADESVSQGIKDSLDKAKKGYLDLKEAAETIVKKDSGKNRNAEEFQKFIVNLWEDVKFSAEEVMDQTAVR